MNTLKSAIAILADVISAQTPDDLLRDAMCYPTEVMHENNLRAQRYDLYTTIGQRRDFYEWFYNHVAVEGYETRWPLAAWIVASNVYHITYMNSGQVPLEWAAAAFGTVTNTLQQVARIGNQVIFDDVFPKLKSLTEYGQLTGVEALAWDAQMLSEEQCLVQPMYAQALASDIDKFEQIAKMNWKITVGSYITGAGEVESGAYNEAGEVPPFPQAANLRDVDDRWHYGMSLAETFRPIGLEFPTRPPAGQVYTDGLRYAQLNVRPSLHFLDAYIDDISTDEEEIVPCLRKLSSSELADLLPDPFRRDSLIDKVKGTLLREWLLDLRVHLVYQLQWIKKQIDSCWLERQDFESATYQQFKPLIQWAPQEQRDQLRTSEWRVFFARLCKNSETMQAALSDLGIFDAATKAEWLSAV